MERPRFPNGMLTKPGSAMLAAARPTPLVDAIFRIIFRGADEQMRRPDTLGHVTSMANLYMAGQRAE
jgi:hypothetical protein